MTPLLTAVIVWLNRGANACAWLLLAPVAVLPGGLSATFTSAFTAVLILVAFKYTSNQAAVRRVRAGIKANLLALSLFDGNVFVSLKSQGRILMGAGRLLSLAVFPTLVMSVPMGLLLSQLAAWYQARPLRVGEEAIVTVHLAPRADTGLPDVQLVPGTAIETTAGPVRIASKRMICWQVQAKQAGYHRVTFETCGQTFDKTWAVGDGFMRLSPRRPTCSWTDALLYPCETPFPQDSIVQAIEVAYPERRSWSAGSNSWLFYWFAASLLFTFALRPLFKVHF